MKETIAIAGAEETQGIEIVKRFSTTPYRLLLLTEFPAKLRTLSKEILQSNPAADITVEKCVKDACWEADVIIMALPFHEVMNIAEEMREVATQKPVIVFSCNQAEVGQLYLQLPFSRIVLASPAREPEGLILYMVEDVVNSEIKKIFSRAGYNIIIKQIINQSI